MISNKDLFMEDRAAYSTEIRMRQEYEAWLQYQALLEWANDRVEQSEQFFSDLRQEHLRPIMVSAQDQTASDELNWFLDGDTVAEDELAGEAEGRQIPFQTQWRISA